MRSSWVVAAGVVLLAVALAGCIGTGEEAVDTASTDVPETNETPETSPLPETIAGLEKLDTVETEGSGTGIWVDEQREILISANGGGGMQLYDVSEADNVTKLGSIEDIYARDADLLRWNGTSYALLAGGGDGIHVVDISDPSSPELVATADKYGSHNLAAVKGTPYVYDSEPVGTVQQAQGGFVPVLNLRNPENPSWTSFEIPRTVNGQPIQSDGCHDVWVQEELDRAYCAGGGGYYTAGGGETFVWNISEGATQPSWVGVIDNPSIMYHHQAVPSEDGNYVYINDEFLAPNCRNVDTPSPAPDVKQTTAAMWVYDISDPANPELKSYVQNPEQTPNANCGSHFGDRIEGHEVLSWSWYGGGTMLIDVSDPANPEILGEVAPEGSTWDARYFDGHIYGSSGNLQVMDVTGNSAE